MKIKAAAILLSGVALNVMADAAPTYLSTHPVNLSADPFEVWQIQDLKRYRGSIDKVILKDQSDIRYEIDFDEGLLVEVARYSGSRLTQRIYYMYGEDPDFPFKQISASNMLKTPDVIDFYRDSAGNIERIVTSTNINRQVAYLWQDDGSVTTLHQGIDIPGYSYDSAMVLSVFDSLGVMKSQSVREAVKPSGIKLDPFKISYHYDKLKTGAKVILSYFGDDKTGFNFRTTHISDHIITRDSVLQPSLADHSLKGSNKKITTTQITENDQFGLWSEVNVCTVVTQKKRSCYIKKRTVERH